MATEWTEFQMIMLIFYGSLLLMAFGVAAYIAKLGVRDATVYIWELMRLTGVWMYLTISMLAALYLVKYPNGLLLLLVFALVGVAFLCKDRFERTFT